MKMRIFIIALLFITGFSFPCFAEESEENLVHLYESLPPNETWMKVTEKLLQTDLDNYDESVVRATNLYTEAKSRGNDYYLRRACYFLVIANYNLSRIKEVNSWFEAYKPLARKAGALDELYECWQCKIQSYADNMDFQRALEEAREMLDDAKNSKNVNGIFWGDVSLGTIYSNIGCLDRSIELFEHAKLLFPKLESSFSKLSCFGYLAITYMRRGESDQTRAILHEMDETIDSMVIKSSKFTRAYDDMRFFISTLYAYSYLKENKLSQAEPYLKKASEHFIPERLKWYKTLYYETRSLYFQILRQYDEALACNDSALVYAKNSLKDYLRYTVQRADIMKLSGNLNGAYHAYKYQTELLDSVSVVMYTKQLEQIRENYNAKQVVLERNKSKVYYGIMIVIVLIACLVFVVWMFWRVKLTESRLKEANKEVEGALRRVEEINETKSKFLRNMSYCVRLPLNAVMGFSQILSSPEGDASLDDETREKISQIMKVNSGNLMQLVNSVLDLSRLESGMMKFVLSDCDIVQICKDAVSMSRMKEGNMAVITFDDQVESQMIHSDEGRLMVIISSMLQDYTSEERRLIVITLRKDEEQKVLKIDVENTPIAYMDDDNQQIFIQREVARLFIEHFGGTFRVEGGAVYFTYPYL